MPQDSENSVVLSIGSIVAIVEGAVIFGLIITLWYVKRSGSGGGGGMRSGGMRGAW